MPTALATAAMLVVMLLHAGFGCCWHHEHGVAELTAGEVRSVPSHGHGHGHRGHVRHAAHGPFAGEFPDGGHDHDECGTDDCRYVSSAPVQPPVVVLVWVGGADAAAETSLPAALTPSGEAGGVNARSDASAPPLRALSRLCVWQV